MGFRPFEYPLDFIPISHFFIFVILYRGSRDNHPVEFFFLYLVEVLVKHHHMFNWSILGRMALEFHEGDVNL